MKVITECPGRMNLYTSIASALVLGVTASMASQAQEGDVEPTQVPDVEVVLVETPEVEQQAAEIEPQPSLPEGVALDNDGNAYPQGGPAGLYNAIIDKQQKLGMTGVYDSDGNLVSITYEGSNHGHQTALSRLRENLERKLNKQGLLDDGAGVPDGEPLQGEIAALTEIPQAQEGAVEELVPQTSLPEGVALDNDGNPYPEGGPAGLYNAIVDKQQKLGMEGVYDTDGTLDSVTYEGSNSGHQTALSRLRENLERKLKKLGLFDDTPEVPDTVDAGDTPAVEELAVSAELGIPGHSVKAAKVKIDRNQKPEKHVKHVKPEKTTRVEKVERVEKISKPVRVERIERPQKPTKITRIEKPQRPQKVTRVEKPQRPEKPQKPAKPERPGRS